MTCDMQWQFCRVNGWPNILSYASLHQVRQLMPQLRWTSVAWCCNSDSACVSGRKSTMRTCEYSCSTVWNQAKGLCSHASNICQKSWYGWSVNCTWRRCLNDVTTYATRCYHMLSPVLHTETSKFTVCSLSMAFWFVLSWAHGPR